MNENNRQVGWNLITEGCVLFALAAALYTLPAWAAIGAIFGTVAIINGIVMLNLSGHEIDNAANAAHLQVSGQVISHNYILNSETTGVSDNRSLLNIKNDGSSIQFDGETLKGGKRKYNESVFKSGDTTYTLSGTDLIVQQGDGDALTITNFHNGDLGIKLSVEKPPKPAFMTAPDYPNNNAAQVLMIEGGVIFVVGVGAIPFCALDK